MIGYHIKKPLLIILSLLLALVFSSCSSESLDKLWLESDGWSRGVLLGKTSLASSVETVVDPDGNIYAVLFPRSEDDNALYQLMLVQLDKIGLIKNRISLDIEISQPRQAKLFLQDNLLDIFWIDSNQAKTIQIDLTGQLKSDITILSGDEIVSHIEVIPWKDGFVIWYAGNKNSPGLYSLTGKVGNFQKKQIDPDGIRINLLLDNEDNLHVSWARNPISYGEAQFFYLETTPDATNISDPTLVFSTGISPSVRIDGPVLGLDAELVYIIWSEAVISGLDAGNRTTYYRYFPLGRPDTIRPPMRLKVPVLSNINPVEYLLGTFPTGDRVPVTGMIPLTSSLENIEILDAQFQETPFVFRSRSEFKWRDFRNQANIAYLSDGLVTSYQPLSYTSAESYYPSVVKDQNMNLYVTWLEKGESTYRAYLTTTDLDKKATIDLVSVDDYLYLAAEGTFGFLAGVVLSPFAAAVWGGAGLLAFIFNIIFSNLNKQIFRTIGENLSIAGGIFIFWWIKVATLPGLGDDYVPFSAWIPRIPVEFEQPLIIGIPILIGVASFATAWLKTYGKKNGSAINFHLIYSAMDSVLSCAIYGILIYGSF